MKPRMKPTYKEAIHALHCLQFSDKCKEEDLVWASLIINLMLEEFK